ncbi:unnamed protein product [Fraxinus pennsylvanica]|uniref:DNA/RNA-binding protein Kin17 WH-like domain-containing protein n=1 Tax=Fraxinus pennsylvanica TaxID=56036 RepID=A0AAD2DTN8_9LAMI|nr:unnamed protein product [Fraxinus pennsylvanica]
MEVFGQNSTRIVDRYSEEFETTFLEHTKRSFRFNRIAATVVTGKCKVNETPKGWFITYIDWDSKTLFKEEEEEKKKIKIKTDMADEEKKERESSRLVFVEVENERRKTNIWKEWGYSISVG